MVRYTIPALLLWASSAWAGEKREAVMDLLNAFETPVSQTDLAALGDGVDAELMAIADDPAVPHTRRANAVVALRFYPTDAVRTFLVAHLLPGQDAMLRRKAAVSLASFGGAAVPELSGALADPDVQLRIAAAHSLATIADAGARAALEQRLPVETEKAVQDAIRQGLGTP